MDNTPIETQADFEKALAELGDNTTPPAATEDTPPVEETPVVKDTTPPAQETPIETPPVETPAVKKPDPDVTAAANAAFAAMRTENAKLKNLVERLATSSGVDPKASPEELARILEERIVAVDAEKMKLPPEILSRMQQYEAGFREMQQEQEKSRVTEAFSRVMEQNGLTPEQTYAFAEELRDTGIQVPAVLHMLPVLYRGMHFDELSESQKTKAVQEALSLQNKAAEQSTTPNKAHGSGAPPKSGPITTIAELEAAFRDLPG